MREIEGAIKQCSKNPGVRRSPPVIPGMKHSEDVLLLKFCDAGGLLLVLGNYVVLGRCILGMDPNHCVIVLLFCFCFVFIDDSFCYSHFSLTSLH